MVFGGRYTCESWFQGQSPGRDFECGTDVQRIGSGGNSNRFRTLRPRRLRRHCPMSQVPLRRVLALDPTRTPGRILLRISRRRPREHRPLQANPASRSRARRRRIENAEQIGYTLRVQTTYVEVPVTVKDTKGNLVPGLTWRDFRVFENGVYQPLKVFSVDPMPLSIAFVIDQSLTRDVMEHVNDSLGAIQGALTPYDELAIFSYSNGSQERTGFTGAQSARGRPRSGLQSARVRTVTEPFADSANYQSPNVPVTCGARFGRGAGQLERRRSRENSRESRTQARACRPQLRVRVRGPLSPLPKTGQTD